MQRGNPHACRGRGRALPIGRALTSTWWRGEDLNLRPSGYEPDELPDCSTPRRALQISTRSGDRFQCYRPGLGPRSPRNATPLGAVVLVVLDVEVEDLDVDDFDEPVFPVACWSCWSTPWRLVTSVP